MLTGILCFLAGKGNAPKTIAILGSLAVLAVALVSLCYTSEKYSTYNAVVYFWNRHLGASMYVSLEGAGRLLCLLTAVAFPIILISTANNDYKRKNAFYGLMMLAQCGITGVFLAKDALLFYFFWELALIPVYFLCSIWGGERRIQATFKFFIYTFVGSLIMLAGIIYVYLRTTGKTYSDGTVALHAFSRQAFMMAELTGPERTGLFFMFLAAFAVKMPIFPLHTWQPDTYDQSPTSVTMVLSGLMVKMGLFGVIFWLLPMFAVGSSVTNAVIILSITGIVYASCIALVQDNIKRLIAYSSIAHVGLMCAALLTRTESGVQGAIMQMFHHGINIIGLWVVADLIEKQTGVKNISQLGGIAKKAPTLTIMLVIVALANIALPLTNSFPGEFLMFNGLFAYNKWMAAAAGLSVILSAVYTLKMIRAVFYGETNPVTENMRDLGWRRMFGLTLIVTMIFAFGVYPQPMIELTRSAVEALVK